MRRAPDTARARAADLIRHPLAPPIGAAAAGLLLVLASGALKAPFQTLSVLFAAGAVAWLGSRLRARSAPPPPDTSPPHLPARPGDETAREALRELERQVVRVREWCGAAAVTLWEVRAQRVRALAAAGRLLPASIAAAGDPLAWVGREGTPLWLQPTPSWSEPGREVSAVRVGSDGDVAWVLTCEYGAGTPRPEHAALEAWSGPLRVVLDVLSAQSRAVAGEKRLENLLLLLRRIPVEIELEAFGRELLDAATALTGASGGTLGTWSEEGGEIVATVGHDGGPTPGAHFAPPHSELGLAIRAGTPLVREAAQWKPGPTQVANDRDEWLSRPRTLISLPLATPSGTVGVLALWSTRASRFEDEALDMLRAVLPYAALHLDHAREYGRLRERADRDALTGLRNRRAFEAAFLAERMRFERYGRPMSLLMIDLDHFKSINDQYGHQAGDEVLRTVARVIQGAVRDVDVPARFGGEEFIVLLPETPLAAAAEVAERVRAAVERAAVLAEGRALDVRVSVGVSSCPERVPTPQALPGSADAALYEAKRGGRNRVELAGSF